ncbi:hypothetical protein [Streptomyces sp. 049-1]|uniref:hypothetical protein n=1 Tax=Streptomyces sp. 049-1 TaxID=2789264 RepID=UPI0039807382
MQSYSLTPQFRLPALQRGLSPAEALATKVNAGLGSALLMSALITPPPIEAFGAVGAAAALLNLAPGPRSVGRWAAVGYRRLRERTAPDSMTSQAGARATWVLYPPHSTMHDPHTRAAWHAKFAAALTYAGTRSRTAGVQVHVTHHATVDDYTDHAQTISVFVPHRVHSSPDRMLDSIAEEFSGLGHLAPAEDLTPPPTVAERGPGWVRMEDGRYAITARVTRWPDVTSGAMMNDLLLGTARQRQARTARGVTRRALWDTDRSFAVLYRPLPASVSRRSHKLTTAIGGAFTVDKTRAAENELTAATAQDALLEGGTLVDVDAYLTVWADSPEDVTDARWEATSIGDSARISLDWLPGQQHRAHVMTTPHAVSTRKGAVL